MSVARHNRTRRLAVQYGLGCLGLSLFLTGCVATVSPPLTESPLPNAWRAQAAAADGAPWHPAQPGDTQLKGAWWNMFGDAVLNTLQAQAQQNSPTLQMAAARVRQARAQVQGVDAGRLPRVDLNGKSTRTQTSANRPAASQGTQAQASLQNDHVLGLGVSYEVDLFGRQALERGSTQALREQAQADLLNAQLVLSADLASVYFGVRSLDAELAVVAQGVQAQARAVGLLQARFEGGAASRLDLAQQQALLDNTHTQQLLLVKQREQTLHALAALVGAPAATFDLPKGVLPQQVPGVPVAVPSEVLQRRPDVAAAQRAVAVSNAQLGVAQVAGYPSLTLSASGGWESKSIGRLLDAPSVFWALGGNLVQTVFDGGRNQARVAQVLAVQEQAVASYRQVVLRTFQEVEDGLTGLNTLAQAQVQAQTATQSAQRVLDIAQDRYTGGLTTYLDVVTAQQNVLNNQRLSSQLRGQQLQMTAYFVKALGGGWQAESLAQAVAGND